MPLRALALVALSLATLLVCAPAVGAQEASEDPPAAEAGEQAEPTEPQETPEPAPAETPVVDVTEVAAEERTTLATLKELTEQVGDDGAVEQVRADLEEWEQEFPAATEQDRGALTTTTSVSYVAELGTTWSGTARSLEAALDVLADRGATLKDSLARIAALKDTWERSLAALDEDAPPTAVQQMQKVLASIDDARQATLASRDELVTLQASVTSLDLEVEALVADIDATLTRLQQNLLSSDAPSIWAVLAGDGLEVSFQPLKEEWSQRVRGLRDYLVGARPLLITQLVVIVVVLAMFITLRRRVAAEGGNGADATTGPTLLDRPLSASVLIGILAGGPLHTSPPVGWRMAVVPIIVVASLRVLLTVLPARWRGGFLWLCTLYVVDSARGLLGGLPVLERLVFIGEALAAATVYFGLQRAVAGSRPWWAVAGLRMAAGLTSAGALCLVLGLVGLGSLITAATIQVTFAAFAFAGLARALDTLLEMTLRTRLLGWLHMVERARDVVQRQLVRLVSLAVLVLFVETALRGFTIRGAVLGAATEVLSAPLELGSLSVSLGDVLAFVLIVWLSFQLSKALRFVFEQDVFPRMDLPRGVPYAASNAMHYAVLLLGFFMAIMAAGVDMGRFAIIGGALGVGVGFGLQNVVNNFVSGLILLFERPVKIGDRVEVADVTGIIERIGIRSSTVRTPDGAEVIVPNANLISDRVTNWTLSDRRRRIIVPIGVAYGIDPERVLELLLSVARGHQNIAAEPEPQALFTAHGESSLDFELRVWTEELNDWVRIRSDLSVAVNRALTEADIEIPFPQRDLHLRSSDVSLVKPRSVDEPRSADEVASG